MSVRRPTRRRRRCVVVVTHEASRTGAPKVAGDVLRALSRHGVRTHLVLRWGGPAENALRDAAASASFEPFRRTRAFARQRHWARLARCIEELAALLVLLRRRPAAVWANTALSACWVRPATALGVPVVLHVHELDPFLSGVIGRYRLGRRWTRVTLVGCSDAVRIDLARVAGVPVDDVVVLRSSVDQDAVRHRAAAVMPTDGDLVVGGCGLANRGKGFDLFLDAVAKVSATHGDSRITFRWVGAVTPEARSALARPGTAPVELIGEVDDAVPQLAVMDVVVVPSRADSFPLVVLEAMALGRPIVAFAVGGIPEQVGDAGRLVPPEDTDALADAISALLADTAIRSELGHRAQERAGRHFGFDRFEDGVRGVLRSAAPGALPPSEELDVTQ